MTTSPDTSKTDGFSAPVQFDSAGQWQITVEIHNGDVTRTTTFTISVT